MVQLYIIKKEKQDKIKMEQKQLTKIHKDMPIAEVLASFPDKAKLLSEILIDFGIHCVGCGAATFETLEEGVLGHGFSEEQLNQLVIDLNNAVSNENVTIDLKQSKVPENFKINLTPEAVEKIKEIMTKEGKENELLRVSVLAGGCSGYSYDLEIIPKENSQKSDIKFKQDGLEIAVDRDSTEFLNGAEIDFIDTLKESGFKFHNPNSSKECGCGKSFS